MTDSSEAIRYEVWSGSKNAEDMALLDAMNTPGEFTLRLPVEPRPESLTDKWGSLHFYGTIAPERVDDLIGECVRADAFRPPEMPSYLYEKWTKEKFAAFVLSRRRLQLPWLVDGKQAPTLAALAAYLFGPILVGYRLDGVQRLVFITAWGEVTRAEFDGTQEELAWVRSNFLGVSLNLAMQQPGLKVIPAAVDPHPLESVARLRIDQLEDWKSERMRTPLKDLARGGLSPSMLQPTDPGRLDIRRMVIASAEHGGHLYELVLPPVGEYAPLDVLCTVDGVLQDYTDTETGLGSGPGAWVSDWADWILSETAPGPNRQQKPGPKWEADGTDADMYRVEHNIVAYSEHETDVARFATAAELQAWVDRSLGSHNARFRVRLLNDITLVLTDCLRPYQRVEFDRSAGEPEVGVARRVFTPWEGVENWRGSDGSYSRCPIIKTRMDGQLLESYSAVHCLDDNWLNNDMLPVGAPATESAWYILRLEGAETAITFPARGTMLTVATDHDGASATIVAREAGERTREHEREHAFEHQWGRWLHDEKPLSREEIRRGLETVHQLVQEARS